MNLLLVWAGGRQLNTVEAKREGSLPQWGLENTKDFQREALRA